MYVFRYFKIKINFTAVYADKGIRLLAKSVKDK